MKIRRIIPAAAIAAVVVIGGAAASVLAASASTPPPWPVPSVTNITSTGTSVTVTLAAESGATFHYLLVSQGRQLVPGAKGPGDSATEPGDGNTTSATVTWTGLAPGTPYEVSFSAEGSGQGTSAWSSWQYAFTVATGGTQGPAGPTGPAGAQGPSGVVAESTTDLGGVTSVATGGGFVASSTEVGSGVSEPAGTYEVCVNAKATPNDTSLAAGAQIFPQLFLYDQAKNAAFTGDLMNTDFGPLEPAATSHDSYANGCTLVTLSGATTLHLYAFGYDSDTGAGTYALDDVSVSVVSVTPAS